MKTDMAWTTAQVVHTEDLSASVRAISLRPAAGVAAWTLGSHLRVQVAVAEGQVLRSYSLVGLPADSQRDGVYRIAVKRSEVSRGGSRAMWRLQQGDALAVAGPDNRFELPTHAPHTLLLAGGIGITPLLGMALTLATRGASVAMCYAVRQREDLVYADALVSALGDSLRCFVSSEGQRLDLAAEIATLPAGAQLVVCGPASLLQAAQTAWRAAGRPAASLRFETFGAGGGAAPEPFWVEVRGCDRPRFEVPADRSLLQALADQGIAALSDCERGECGLCAVDVVALEGQIDHQDVFLSEDQRLDNRRLCACVSRVRGGGVVLDTGYRPDPR